MKWVNEIKLVDDQAKATWQLLEFERKYEPGRLRGPQPGLYRHPFGPVFAKDYIAATIDRTALPVHVEQWKLGGKIVYRIVGIAWACRFLREDGDPLHGGAE